MATLYNDSSLGTNTLTYTHWHTPSSMSGNQTTEGSRFVSVSVCVFITCGKIFMLCVVAVSLQEDEMGEKIRYGGK